MWGSGEPELMKWRKVKVLPRSQALLTLLILTAGDLGEPGVHAQRHSRHKKKQEEQCAQWEAVYTAAPGARLAARDVGGFLGHTPSLPLSQRKGLKPASALQVLPVIDGGVRDGGEAKGRGKSGRK